MNRIQTFCPCCEQMVELYSDHMCISGSTHRCGNCFYPFWPDDLEAAAKLHDELKAHDLKRATLLEEHRRKM